MTRALEQAILHRLAEGIHQRLGRVPQEEAERIDPDWVADAMLDAIPTAHPFEQLGPFYDTTGLARWLGISRQALHQRVKSHQLLAPVTADGQRVYPAWQFAPDGSTLQGFSAVLRVLLSGIDEWTAAIWLTTPSDRFDGRTAVDLLAAPRTAPRDDDALDVVLAAAGEDAARWVQ